MSNTIRMVYFVETMPYFGKIKKIAESFGPNFQKSKILNILLSQTAERVESFSPSGVRIEVIPSFLDDLVAGERHYNRYGGKLCVISNLNCFSDPLRLIESFESFIENNERYVPDAIRRGSNYNIADKVLAKFGKTLERELSWGGIRGKLVVDRLNT